MHAACWHSSLNFSFLFFIFFFFLFSSSSFLLGQQQKQLESAECAIKDVQCWPLQVCLKWNVQRGVPVIPRSQNPKNIKANIEGIFEWVLPRAAKVHLHPMHLTARCPA